MITIADRFKHLRQDKKLTQKKFSERILVTPSYISMVESGKEEPSEVLIKLTALEFSASYEWLKNGEGFMYLNPNEFDILERTNAETYKAQFYDLTENLVRSFEKFKDSDSGSSYINISVIIDMITKIFEVQTATHTQKELLISILASFMIEMEEKIQRCLNADLNDRGSIYDAIRFTKNVSEFRSGLDEITSIFFEDKLRTINDNV